MACHTGEPVAALPVAPALGKAMRLEEIGMLRGEVLGRDVLRGAMTSPAKRGDPRPSQAAQSLHADVARVPAAHRLDVGASRAVACLAADAEKPLLRGDR